MSHVIDQKNNKINNYIRLGNFVEYYDFSLYTFFAPVISRAFLNTDTLLNDAIYGYAVLAFTYLIRPLGGIIFGIIGDIKGRAYALTLSILVMGLSTIMISLSPAYTSIGYSASILLICCRAIQCFSLGGEFTNALVLSYEVNGIRKRGTTIGMFISTGTLGWFAGSSIALITMQYESVFDNVDYTWRIPFFLGGIISIFLFYIRRKYSTQSTQEVSISDAKLHRLKLNKTTLLKVFSVIIFAGWNGTLFYGLFIYPPVYSALKAGVKFNEYSNYTNTCMFFYFIFLISFGVVIDKVKNKLLVVYLVPLVIPAVLLIYNLISSLSSATLFLAAIFSAAITALVMNITSFLIPGLFEREYRSRLVSLFYNVGIAIFGATTPLMCTVLYKNISDSMPFIYIGLISVISTVFLIYIGVISLQTKKQ